MNKREFIKASLGIMVFSALKPVSGLSNKIYNTPNETLRLWDKLSPEEESKCKNCTLSHADIKEKVKQGYKCGQVLMEQYISDNQLSSSLLDTTIGIGDGFGKKDRCCLLISSILIFGVHASSLSTDMRTKITYCKKMNAEFWDWWQKLAPLNCYDIQPNCYEGYPLMYKRTALKVSEIISNFKAE